MPVLPRQFLFCSLFWNQRRTGSQEHRRSLSCFGQTSVGCGNLITDLLPTMNQTPIRCSTFRQGCGRAHYPLSPGAGYFQTSNGITPRAMLRQCYLLWGPIL
jgi:hypothetical protein